MSGVPHPKHDQERSIVSFMQEVDGRGSDVLQIVVWVPILYLENGFLYTK